jgi:putative nucleotidyltransferase with HDIG domain
MSGPHPEAPPPVADLLARLRGRVHAGKLALPLLPAVAGEVVALSSDEERCDARALSERIQRDPSLAGNVLKVANSAAFAPDEPIVSLQHAVGRLGLRTLRDIALAVALRGEVFHAGGREAEVRELWEHCAAAAVWAREIARSRRRNVESAFLAGLLHDAGKPLVIEAALAIGIEDPATLVRCVQELHEEVGARLVESWELGPRLAGAVAFHHRPERAGEHVELASTVRLADLLAHWSRSAETAPGRELASDPSLAQLGIYPADLERLSAARAAVLATAGGFA